MAEKLHIFVKNNIFQIFREINSHKLASQQTILGKLMCGLQTVCKPHYFRILNSPKKTIQSVYDILIFISDKLVMVQRNGGWGGEKGQR